VGEAATDLPAWPHSEKPFERTPHCPIEQEEDAALGEGALHQVIDDRAWLMLTKRTNAG
jgi:hypothetical protein